MTTTSIVKIIEVHVGDLECDSYDCLLLLVECVVLFPFLSFFMVVLLVLDPWLGFLTLCIVPILIVVRLVWIPYARRAFLAAREASSTANGALAENVHGIRAIQGMARERVNLELFEDKARANLEAHLTASKLTNIMIPIVDVLTGCALAVIVVIVLVGGALLPFFVARGWFAIYTPLTLQRFVPPRLGLLPAG